MSPGGRAQPVRVECVHRDRDRHGRIDIRDRCLVFGGLRRASDSGLPADRVKLTRRDPKLDLLTIVNGDREALSTAVRNLLGSCAEKMPASSNAWPLSRM